MKQSDLTEDLVNSIKSLPDEKVKKVLEYICSLKEPEINENILLEKSGLTQQEAFDLRNRLSTFTEDWNSSEMNIYDKL
jgi:hypothetical protein